MTQLDSFDDFVDVTDREIQAVIGKTEQKDLVVALWAGSEEVKEKFLRNMTGELLTFVNGELAFLDPIAPWCQPESDHDIPSLCSFDDLLKLTGREIQAGLREIDQKDIAVALKRAGEEVKEALLSNLSARVRALVEEELIASESIAPEEIESAQKRCLETTTIETGKAVEKVKRGIVTVREQMVQVHQSDSRL